MKITLAKFEGEAKLPESLATCLEYALLWAEEENNSADLLRLCAAAIGVGLDHLAMLPKYKPQKQKIPEYGYIVLERLLNQNVRPPEIFNAGTQILTSMAKRIPSSEASEDAKNFLASPEEGS